MKLALRLWALGFLGVALASANALAQSISAKDGHVTALDEAGRVLTWGGDSFGQLGVGRSVFEASPRKIAGLPAIQTVSTGVAHMLALTTTGEVWSWGNNTDGQLGIRDELNNARPAKIRGLSGVMAVAAGGNFSAAVTRDGSVYVWGKNPVTKQGLNVPEKLEGVRGARSLAAGRAHLLILRTDSTVLSAGDNTYGQLGDGTKDRRDALIRVPRLSGVEQISAGGDMSMALTADARPFAWGTTDLSSPLETEVLSPILVRDVHLITLARGTRIVQLVGNSSDVLGAGGGLARLANGDLLFWRTVNTALVPRITPPRDVVGVADSITNGARSFFSLLPNGDIQVTGYNGDGQWGNGTTSVGDFNEVATVAGLAARQIFANAGYAAAVSAAGDVHVWGANSAGVAADGGLAYRAVPNLVPGVADVVKVASGRGFSLALTKSGDVFAWGENASGQLGVGSRTRQSSPVRIAGLSGIVDIAAGCEFSLFVRADGRVLRAGIAFDSLNTSPVQITFGVSGIRKAFATCNAGFLLTETNRLLGFGINNRGQVGQGAASPNQFAPSLVNGITTDVVSVVGSELHTVALTTDGKVWTWGDNGRGQLGASPSAFDATPQFIPNLPRAKAIAAGRFHTLILFEDGTVGGVGANTGGELGTGSRADTSVVSPTRRLTDVVSITAGVSTSYAIRADGSTWGWGRSTESAFQEAVGDGTYVDRAEPVLVLAASASGNLDRGDWFLDLKPSVANNLPASAGRAIVPVAQLFGGSQGASLATSINFREQDYGRNVGTYVMGLVPRDFLEVAEVASAENPVERHAEVKRRPKSKSGSDLVLVQLTPTGWQVVTGQLTALTTNVIQGNSTAQRILNNINLALIPGAQFCVGYGTNANDMLQGGTLAEVLTIPGASATSGGLPCVRSGAYLSGPDESKVGSPVTFVATVVGISPTGNVSLRNGNAVLDAKPLPITSGESIARAVRFELASLAAGRYTLLADYAGDGSPNNPSAASAGLAHRRQAVPSLAIFAPASSDAGQTVTITARITAASGLAGSIVFKDDGVAIGPAVALGAGGEASISVRDLTPGAHTITAEFSGDDLNAGARATLAHTVRSNAVDTTPDAFSFADQRDTERNVWVVSEPITVRGINAAAAVAITNGEYAIECTDNYLTTPGAVDSGQRICVRHRSSNLAQANTTTTLNVGGVAAMFTSQTRIDPQGLPAEGDFDNDGIPNGIELAEGTNPRAKDNDVFTNARLFTMQVYRDSLDREGDAGGVNFWQEQIARGSQTRLQMLELFIASPEFEGRIAPVIRLYLAYFNRVPDFSGLKYWQSQVAVNGLDAVSEAFATSNEFSSRTRGLSDDDYVRFVFQNTIGRAPDAGGLAFWSAKLRFGEVTRGQLMARFSESSEYKTLATNRVAVISLYAAMLRRTPEDAGLTFWVGERQRLGNSQALAGAFFGSPEYRTRFLP